MIWISMREMGLKGRTSLLSDGSKLAFEVRPEAQACDLHFTMTVNMTGISLTRVELQDTDFLRKCHKSRFAVSL